MTAPNGGRPEPSLAAVIDALRRGLAAEVRFLRRPAARVPEVALRGGRALERTSAGRWRYRFETGEAAVERFLDQDAMLVAPATALRASLIEVAGSDVVVEVEQPILPAEPGWRLVLRPGMLLERLGETLERCAHDPGFCAETALRSLGLRPSRRVTAAATMAEGDLNESQRRAVASARERDLTLIWGPPGTGKTRVIARLVAALCRDGERVLLTSNTHAAVDNAIEALRAELATGPAFPIYRVKGGAARAATSSDRALEQRRRLALRTGQAQQCRRLLEQVGAARPQQLLAFADPGPVISPTRLGELFPGREYAVSGLRREALVACLALRLRRLETLVRGYQDRLGPADAQPGLAREPLVVAATLTSTYTTAKLASERFDAVVVDEASMAGLPLIFHCAGLATRRAVFVGDPRQLPPICEAPDPVVRATLGRTIFDLGGQGRLEGDGRVLLDIQYRMHPAIGGLVSDLYYQGALKSASPAPETVRIVEAEPFPGSPLLLVDLAGTQHRCERHGQSSRINRLSAEAAVGLAAAAARSGAQVAVITPYAAQARLVRTMVAAAAPSAGISCATVHRFQGAEADVVIIDLVDGAPLRPGLLLNDQGPGSAAPALLNVSVSRARAKLIVLADVAYFRAQGGDGPVVQLLRCLEERGRVIPHLSL